MTRARVDCMNYDGDEDCMKCCKRGYIFGCPEPCEDYVDFWGKTDGDKEAENEERGQGLPEV